MKQCEKCGQAIDDNAAFCTNCGAAVSSGPAPVAPDMGQPMGAGAPAVNGMVASGPAMSPAAPIDEPKKKMDGKMIALIAVSAVCLIIGIVGIVLAIMNGGNKGSSGNGGQVATGNSGSSTVDVASSGTKVSYAGYEFVIPDGYDYEIADSPVGETLVTSNDDGYAAATVYDNSVTFTQIENNLDAVARELENEVGISATTSIENVDGVKFLCLDFGTVEGANLTYAISEIDLYYFQTAIATMPGVSGKQYLSNVAKIVGSAQKKKSMDKGLNGNGFKDIKIQKLVVQSE